MSRFSYYFIGKIYSISSSISMDEAKEVHTSLRKAAGAFQLTTQSFIPELVNHPDPGMDLDPRVAGAYLAQCTAEAQESMHGGIN
jgi:hypothetical protein